MAPTTPTQPATATATATTTTYRIEMRSQKSVGGGHGKFGGPDTYVAVQVVPPGVEPLKALDRRMAAKRGIEILYFGEGYRKHRGPGSALGKALAAAEAWIVERSQDAQVGPDIVIRIASAPCGAGDAFMHPACVGSLTNVEYHDLTIAELLDQGIEVCDSCGERIVPKGAHI